MRDATHTLTCSLLADLPSSLSSSLSSLYSPLFLPSINSSGAPGTAFVSSLAPTPLPSSLSLSLSFHPPQDPSPQLSHTSLSPAVFSSLTAHSCLALSILCRKQTIKQAFLLVRKVELLDDCVGYPQSINCVLVYSIRNVTRRGGAVINGTHELGSLQIVLLPICIPNVTRRTLVGHACVSRRHRSNSRLALTNSSAPTICFDIILGFVLQKDTRSVRLLKCRPARDKKMGADEIRLKIK